MSDVLILGATGTNGSRLVPLLAGAGYAVRAATRHPDRDGLPDGAAMVRFDWDDPSSWAAALAGAEGVFLVAPAPRLDPAEAMTAFVRQAAAAGVQRIVMLSARAVAHAPASVPLRRVEEAVKASGPAWTILRPAWFVQNFTSGVFAQGVLERGELIAPTGDGRVPFSDAHDIAAVAAAALTEDGHAGREYALSGSVAHSFADAAVLLSEVLGRTIRHIDLPSQPWSSAAVSAFGVPADYAAFLAERFDAIRAGEDAYISDGVQRVLGREPTPLASALTRELTSARRPGSGRPIAITPVSRLGIVNAYLVQEDDGLTLIDTGLPGTHRRILAHARRLGLPIVRIALTHAHTDHAGSLDALTAALPGVEVIVSEREAPLMRGDKTLHDDEPRDRLRGGFPVTGTVPARIVRHGDHVGSLRVVATPGHTPGHISFVDTRDGTVYGGDVFTTRRGVATSAVVSWRYPMAGLATWSRELALQSARALRELKPERLAPGHGDVVEKPAHAMDRAITAAAKRLASEHGDVVEQPARPMERAIAASAKRP